MTFSTYSNYVHTKQTFDEQGPCRPKTRNQQGPGPPRRNTAPSDEEWPGQEKNNNKHLAVSLQTLFRNGSEDDNETKVSNAKSKETSLNKIYMSKCTCP